MNNHRIPNEFSRSDKIGPFTMSQAGVLGGGALVLMILLFTIKSLVILFVSIVVLTLLIAGLMFIKVNKMPVYEFLFKYTMFSFSPRLLVFRSDNVKNVDLGDELIGFQERYIAENTKKTIKKDKKSSSKKDQQKEVKNVVKKSEGSKKKK